MAARLTLRAALVSLASMTASLGCGGPDGHATVRGRLAINDCFAVRPETLQGYQFDAGYLATERFAGVLLVYILRDAVEIEETDGLTIRLDLGHLTDEGLIFDTGQGKIVPTDATKPLVVRTSTRPEDANVALSLFSTCPGFPTVNATAGVLTLDHLVLASDPTETGRGERIAGSLTATVSRASSRKPVGTIDAAFDFAPPRRPLTDFK